ncbi:MAG: MBL fold metallo-hydrolase, partial [Thermodesulfovibrionales bacterium]|nr:MBL fold metallo-hydrolase [Thermodesulfovibrionales bacterium]
PIGQGAFYSERHDKFNIVYDCGNWKNTKLADKVVINSFHKNDEIDILFISHFDYDHVSKIDTLKNKFKIKKVVMPLLHGNEKIFLVNFYNNLGLTKISLLVNNPSEFFDSETSVIAVGIAENNENKDGDGVLQIDDITSLPREVKSGTALKINDWVFVPFNFQYTSRSLELEVYFKEWGLDIQRFKKDIDYPENRQLIKKIYEKVTGRINQNSMLVYSGPENDDRRFVCSHYRCHGCYPDCEICCCECHPRSRNRAGCIYTGDADLNVSRSRIDVIYKKYWKNVGTIQIPHHGDIKSFNKNVLTGKGYFCPISVGTSNSYGHPHNQLMAEVILNDSCPILVTEKLDSGFFQRIV